MTPKDPDIVTDILQRAMAVVRAELAPAGIDRLTIEALVTHIGALEKPVRRDYARADVYVAARSSGHAQAKALALEEVRRTGNVAAATRHGVSRATLYRMLKK
jgi:hypothetical protein